MLNDETKRKLRELNIGELIDAIEYQNQCYGSVNSTTQSPTKSTNLS